MTEHELSPGARPRARGVLRLVPPPPPEPPLPPGQRVLLEVDGLRLTGERLEVEGRSYRLEDIRWLGTRHRAPRLWPSLVGAVLGALGAAVLLALPGSAPVYAALAGVGALVGGSVAWVVVATDTYWLTVCTEEGARQVLRSEDHQRFGRVVAVLGDALLAARLEAKRPRASAAG